MKVYNDFDRISLKDVMDILGVSYGASIYIRRDIAEYFGIPTTRVFYKHLKEYFKL